MGNYKITSKGLDRFPLELNKWYLFKMGYGCFLKDGEAGEIEHLPKDMVKFQITDLETGAKFSTFTYHKEIDK